MERTGALVREHGRSVVGRGPTPSAVARPARETNFGGRSLHKPSPACAGKRSGDRQGHWARARGGQPFDRAELWRVGGQDFEDIQLTTPAIYRAWEEDPGNLAPPEGESGVQLIERVMPFLEEMAQRHQSGNAVVVCHKTVCRLLACHIMGTPLSEYRRRLVMENAALNIFEAREGNWRVVTLNDTSHLRKDPLRNAS